MQINVIYDQSPSTLPAGFVTAVNYVVNYFDTTFTNNVTVNIDLGYGEIGNNPNNVLGQNALGESETFFDSYSGATGYNQVVNALKANEPSATQQAAYSTLPGSNPLSGGTLWLSTAEEKALGLLASNSSAIDGYVGISNYYPFSYSTSGSVGSNQYYFIGVLAHEFSEVLGRDSLLGEGLGGTNSDSITDLFRYSSPGTRQLGTGGPAYFSINNGVTNLNSWNTNPLGDLGDWAASAGTDAFLAFSPSGQADWITQNDLSLMNVLGYDVTSPAGTPTSTPTGAPTVVGIGNFNNDGDADVVFDNASVVATWEMNGAQAVTRAVIDSSLPTGWQIVGIGDFNADHMSDVLLRYTDGTVGVWLMNGTQIQSPAIVASPPSSWRVVGTADFNGDGKSDVLFQNTDGTVGIWLMNGSHLQSAAVIASPPSSWRVVGIGDFSGDHGTDIVLQNANGDVGIWEMNGAQYVSGAIVASPGTNWTVLGTGDFSGDGTTDILLQNSSGSVSIWEMNGSNIVSNTIVGTMTTDWHFAGIGDFNGDNKGDILWQNNTDALEVWLMNGTQVSSAVVTPPNGAPIGGSLPTSSTAVGGTTAQGEIDQPIALMSQYMATISDQSDVGGVDSRILSLHDQSGFLALPGTGGSSRS
jgi:hypothetical protein